MSVVEITTRYNIMVVVEETECANRHGSFQVFIFACSIQCVGGAVTHIAAGTQSETFDRIVVDT